MQPHNANLHSKFLFLISFFTDYGYWAVLFVLIICGFGVPIPEDITLVSGGVIAGLYPESVNSHLMLVVSMIGVLTGDSTMYWLGRIYGTRILRFRPMRKIVTLERLKMVREKFAQYGNRVLFVARFLPGLRAPIYMVSGITRRVSYTRFVLIDFCAAIISVPIWVYLGEFGAKNLDWLHEQIKKGQLVIYILVGTLAVFLFWKWKKAKKSKVN
ncbi:MAG: DedA family protein [Haemophilus parainfluenzae]|nr:DedA family protein [Haemophilus parainfluenzae]